jgi:hypothetical protein
MILREDEDLPRDKEPLRRDRGFGVLLLLAGKDWDTREQRERSMQLFMSDVAPRLANLDPDRAVA